MNDEIIAMTRRIMRGIEVSDDALMLDLIDQVGPGGEFMSLEVTAKRCRAEIWNPTLMDRQPWDVWEAAGSKTATDRIRAKLKNILARHTPPARQKRSRRFCGKQRRGRKRSEIASNSICRYSVSRECRAPCRLSPLARQGLDVWSGMFLTDNNKNRPSTGG